MNQIANACAARLPLGVAADLQDHLLTVASDLERLQTLLDDSHHTLQAGFFGALQLLQELRDAGQLDAAPVGRVREHLGCAVKALQFQDMAAPDLPRVAFPLTSFPSASAQARVFLNRIS